jgi:hypothetical protein
MEVKWMKTWDLVKFVLFCALLFIVVIEFIMNLSINSATDIERLRYYIGVLTNLGILDKAIIIALLGVLAFPKEE